MLKSKITKELFAGFIVITAIVSLVLSIIALTKKCDNSKETFDDDNLPTCQGNKTDFNEGACIINSINTNCEESYTQDDYGEFKQCNCGFDKDSCNYNKPNVNFCYASSYKCKPPN